MYKQPTDFDSYIYIYIYINIKKVYLQITNKLDNYETKKVSLAESCRWVLDVKQNPEK